MQANLRKIVSIPFLSFNLSQIQASQYSPRHINLNERDVEKREAVPAEEQGERGLQPILVLQQDHPLPGQPGSPVAQQLLPLHAQHLLRHRQPQPRRARLPLRRTHSLTQYDLKFQKNNPNYYQYDFNHPEAIPQKYHNFFDFVLADPPFITF